MESTPQSESPRDAAPSDAADAPLARRLRRALGRRLRGTWHEIRRSPWLLGAVATSILVGLVLLGMALTLIPSAHPLGTPAERLELALQALEDGETATARRLATELRSHPKLTFQQLGGPAFILGVILVQDAQGDWNSVERRNDYLIASRYLEEAAERGFPTGFEKDGRYLLGVSLYHSGRLAESLPVLLETREQTPEHTLEMDRYLSHVYTVLDPPDNERALWHNQQYLAATDLTREDRVSELLHQSRLLLELDDQDRARETLSRVIELAEPGTGLQDPRSYLTSATVMRGRLLLEQADDIQNRGESPDPEAARQLYEAARDLFRSAHLKSLDNSQTSYFLALAHRKLGDLSEAEKQFRITRRRNYTTPEAFAAFVQEAEIQRQLGQHSEALQSYRKILHEAPKPNEYDNPWVTLEQLRDYLLATYQKALADKRFAEADSLVDSFVPTFPKDQAVQLKAETQQTWAEHLTAQAQQTSGPPAEKLAEQARRHHHHAGQMYKQLADMRLATRAYPDDIWAAAENYLQSGDFRETVRLLQRYMEHEPKKRRPRALTQLGNALLSLDRVDEALVPLQECLEFHPKHPDSYRARILAAHASFEKQDLAAAEELLRKNLEHEALTPQSIEWRDSQFLLGKYTFKEGQVLEGRSRDLGIDDPTSPTHKEAFDALSEAADKYDESLRRLASAVERYPDAPQATEARYLIAQAHVNRAKYPQKRLAYESIPTTKIDLNRQIRAELEEALKQFWNLQERLTAKQDDYELTDVEGRILRNCYFARGHALFDLGDYAEAIKAYASATNSYQNQPASLEAYVQIANCYRRQGNHFRARGTLEQALAVLEQIPDDADFSTTRFESREPWPKLLNWLKSL